MNFMWAGYEIINITCLVGIKEAGDPCAQRCSNLQADGTGNNEALHLRRVLMLNVRLW